MAAIAATGTPETSRRDPTESAYKVKAVVPADIVRRPSLPQSLVRPFNHRLCGSHLIISAGRRSLYVDDNGVLDVDEIIEAFAVQAEHGSTGEITFGSLRLASASSSSRAVRNSATARVWHSGDDQSISSGALP